MHESGLKLQDIDSVAYTQGPGLAGALLVGSAFAKSLAQGLNLPSIGVHHLEGHLLSPLLGVSVPEFPFIALLVSGGHTQLMLVSGVGKYQLLGETLDDAAGEALDKTAKLLGLDYPGGAAISKLAEKGQSGRFDLPKPMLHSGCKHLVLAGGVGANLQLRAALHASAKKNRFEVHYPPVDLCTDNGVMIAFTGALRMLVENNGSTTSGAFDIKPRWDLASNNLS